MNEKDNLVKGYEEQGFEVTNVKKSQISNKGYLTMELKKEGKNILALYRSAPKSDTFVVMVSSKDNEIKYQEIENVENILKQVKVNNINS